MSIYNKQYDVSQVYFKHITSYISIDMQKLCLCTSVSWERERERERERETLHTKRSVKKYYMSMEIH